MTIQEIKSKEMSEILDFYEFIQEYGHIFYGTEEELDKPFKKILEGIEEVRNIVNEYYSY